MSSHLTRSRSRASSALKNWLRAAQGETAEILVGGMLHSEAGKQVNGTPEKGFKLLLEFNVLKTEPRAGFKRSQDIEVAVRPCIASRETAESFEFHHMEPTANVRQPAVINVEIVQVHRIILA